MAIKFYWRLILFTFLILPFIGGCLLFSKQRKYTFKERKFSLENVIEDQKVDLDTNAFYILGREKYNIKRGQVDSTYHVLKFNNNGTFKWTHFEHIPNMEEVLLDTLSETHYYIIENGQIILEVYYDAMVGMSYWKGSIFDNSIIFHKIDRKKIHYVYKKMGSSQK